MDSDKLRRQICFQAAQLLHSRRESNFTTARWRAARSLTRSYLSRESLPTDMEIRSVLQELASTQLATDRQFVLESEQSDDFTDARFEQIMHLLEPLDKVRLNRHEHPEGDLLYHSLQVFHLANEGRPWDEEFLIAALLHDVGHGIDPIDAHLATLRVVSPLVSERTFWLIKNLPLQHRKADGTIGARARRRLASHDDGEELRFLAECDLQGRVPGKNVGSLEDAILTIQTLADEAS